MGRGGRGGTARVGAAGRECPPVLPGCGRRRVGGGRAEQAPGVLGGRRRAGDAELAVTNFDEAPGLDVEQEAADELVGGECDVTPVLGREAGTGWRDSAQAVIRKADAMRVAAEIAEELPGAREGGLGRDDPGLAGELS